MDNTVNGIPREDWIELSGEEKVAQRRRWHEEQGKAPSRAPAPIPKLPTVAEIDELRHLLPKSSKPAETGTAATIPPPRPAPVLKSLHPDEQPKSARQADLQKFNRDAEAALQRAAERGDPFAQRTLARTARQDPLEERVRQGEVEDRAAGTDERLPVEDRAGRTFDLSPGIRMTSSRGAYIAERRQAEEQFARSRRRRA